VALLATPPANAQDPWAGQTFLSDYSKLQLVEGKEGRDYLYIVPEGEYRIGRYRKVLLDQPEVFISSESPYKGAKPQDLSAISSLVRSTAAAALQERGYALVDQPAQDVAYVRLAVSDLRIDKKKRNLLAYTPIGFVVSEGAKALQDFMDKYDILDMSLQVEVLDSVQLDVLGSGVIKRGKGADVNRRYAFDELTAVVTEYSGRLACRLDNSHVEAAERIDCHDPGARNARPKVVSP
jgi:hypothetical protein